MSTEAAVRPLSREEAWAIVLENEALVKKVTNDFVEVWVSREFDDCLSVAFEGALAAVESFEEGRGRKLSSWMVLVMKQHLLRENERHQRQTHRLTYERGHRVTGSERMSFPAQLLTSDEQHVRDDDNFEIDAPFTEEGFEDELVDRIARDDDFQRVSMAILSQLSEREQEVLRLHYFERLTFEEIAEKWDGISRQRVQQIHARALRKVREAL